MLNKGKSANNKRGLGFIETGISSIPPSSQTPPPINGKTMFIYSIKI